ncbi:leucine-rich repeat domain-containing protein [uncultured Eubacterium sp.]|jgi:hypothetical protein|uniref:leucine-rich repeat domain-containing protein n=1 Tax=Eubacterium sp. TaxID=142586 RepID=UPI0032646EC8
MSKRIYKFITIMLAAVMVLSCWNDCGMATNVYAAKHVTVTKNTKHNVKWKLKKGVLTIYGKGKMPNNMTFDYEKYKGKIKKVIIKEGVESVCDNAFYFIKSIKEVQFPKSLKEIGENAFEYNKLKKVELKSKVKIKENGLELYHAKYINIPIKGGKISLKNGVMNITGKGEIPVRVGNAYVKEINIGKGITTLPMWAFSGSANLKKLKISKTVEEINANAFSKTGLKEINIPSGVKRIGPNIFSECSKLTKVTMPGEFEFIARDGEESTPMRNVIDKRDTNVDVVKFNTPLNLDVISGIDTNNFVVVKNDPNYKVINGVIYSKDGRNLVRVPSKRTELKVEDGCEYVASSAFLYGLYESDGDEWFLRCSNLTKIELANSVKQICLETDNYYDRTEKKQCNKMGDYLETIETLSMRDFNLQEITYKGRTVKTQTFIKQIFGKTRNNGVLDLTDELNNTIKSNQ